MGRINLGRVRTRITRKLQGGVNRWNVDVTLPGNRKEGSTRTVTAANAEAAARLRLRALIKEPLIFGMGLRTIVAGIRVDVTNVMEPRHTSHFTTRFTTQGGVVRFAENIREAKPRPRKMKGPKLTR